MKVKVLHIVNQFKSGGIREFILNYYRAIDRNKFTFYFLVQRDFTIPEDDEITALGGKIIFGPKMYKNDREYYIFLRNYLLQNRDIQIVHSHLNLRSLLPLYTAKKVGISVRIAHCHKNENNENIIQLIKRKIICRLIRIYCNVKCACSSNAAKYMFTRDTDVKVINNAICVDNFRYNESTRIKLREKFNLTDKIVIGHVGNFSAEKNHSFLIKVFEEIIKRNNLVCLVLIGDGENYKKITEAVNNSILIRDNVLFLGTQSNIYNYYQMFDLFIFPSLSEGFGMAILEAECAGVPTLVSSEIHSEACNIGLCAKMSLKEQPAKWAEKILSMYPGRNNNAYKVVEDSGYNISTNASILERTYLEALK